MAPYSSIFIFELDIEKVNSSLSKSSNTIDPTLIWFSFILNVLLEVIWGALSFTLIIAITIVSVVNKLPFTSVAVIINSIFLVFS